MVAMHESPLEITLRGLLLSVVLTLVLAVSNAYLALKLGILTSASIPAAIIAMGVLRFFKDSTVQEHNAVQTAASAGEAVAGGIVYTIPALIIIGYWHGFDYATNFMIAFLGGVLGVLFSIPLRRMLVHDKRLAFPEGRAIAEVLKSAQEEFGAKAILWGGILGSTLELLQMGFQIISSHWSYWFGLKRVIVGFGFGFSATMVGTGILMGHEMAVSIFVGALLSWGLGVPLMSWLHPEILAHHSTFDAVTLLRNQYLQFIGIGAMLLAGLWTFVFLAKPLVTRMRDAYQNPHLRARDLSSRVEKDIPTKFLWFGFLAMLGLLWVFCQKIFPLHDFGTHFGLSGTVLVSMVFYVVVVGFFFSVITAYFSGMVGVTASPGSSVVIAGIFFAAWLLQRLLQLFIPLPLSDAQIQAAEAIVIITSSVVTGIAAIANDNTQDLKVGQLVGATPWKQQLMLLFGVLISALVIPWVMHLLYQVYGIAGMMPREGMNQDASLPAPTAALLAAVTQAVFSHQVPWMMMLFGGFIITSMIIAQNIVPRVRWMAKLSTMGVAMGMYLPISASFPVFAGGMMAWTFKRKAQQQSLQRSTLMACGLVAGSALMDVVLAVPFSIQGSPNALRWVGSDWTPYGVLLGFVSLYGIYQWLQYYATRQNQKHLL